MQQRDQGYTHLLDHLQAVLQILQNLSDAAQDQALSDLAQASRQKAAEFQELLHESENLRRDDPKVVQTDPRLAHLQLTLDLSINLALAQIIEVLREFERRHLSVLHSLQDNRQTMAAYIYHMANLIPIINDFSQSTNNFSHSIIVDVVTHFEKIADFSGNITGDIQRSMQQLMDVNRQDSLAAVVEQAHQIVLDFEEFFGRMENMKHISDNFVSITIEKLSHISDIALSIENISETIKVLSLNVSIEAANTGASARGFQVLSRDLREFAQRTLKFAGEVKAKVQDTITTTNNLRDSYQENMDIFYQYVSTLKNTILAFETVIRQSFTHIQSITLTLEEFSAKLSSSVKQIIGKLQYQDITNQEVEHISSFIMQIFQMANQEIKDSHVVDLLDPEHRHHIRSEILASINSIITTSNERKILEEYEEIYDVQLEDSGILDFSRSLQAQEDQEIIIF